MVNAAKTFKHRCMLGSDGCGLCRGTRSLDCERVGIALAQDVLLSRLQLADIVGQQMLFFSAAIKVADDKSIHLGSQVARDGLVWRLDDRLATVKACVEKDRHTRMICESLNDRIEGRVRRSAYRLDTRGSVEMYNRRY